MRIKRKQLSVAVLHALSVSVAVGLALPANAQQAAKSDAPQKAEKIEVTGSRIPTANLEGASPVTVIDA